MNVRSGSHQVQLGGSGDPPTTTVLIVDDHRAFAEALGIAIDLQPDLEQVGAATTVEEAMGIVSDASPDVVLMDIRLPGTDGIEGVRMIKELDGQVRVVVLTGFADADTMARAALVREAAERVS